MNVMQQLLPKYSYQLLDRIASSGFFSRWSFTYSRLLQVQGSIGSNTLREMCLYFITFPKYTLVKGYRGKEENSLFPIAGVKFSNLPNGSVCMCVLSHSVMAIYALTTCGFCSNLLESSKSCVRTSFQGMVQKGYTTDRVLTGQEAKNLRTSN